MGAWDYGTLDNDDAQDFVGDLLDSRGDRWRIVEAALDLVVDAAADVTDIPDESAALAASEIVAAAASGAAADDLDEEVAAWAMRTAPKHLHMLSQRAIWAVNRISERSELQQAWEKSGDYRLWLDELEDLKRRLTITIH
jgi:hypothetical protein